MSAADRRLLLSPAALWYLILLGPAARHRRHLLFGTRARNGGYEAAFVLDNYARAISRPQPFIDSLVMAATGTIGCLLVGLPLAYFLATRAGRRKGLLILLLVVPFWTSFLIRTYAWIIILGPGGRRLLARNPDRPGPRRSVGTPVAVLIGLVYGYLPLMVFPLYVTLERMDRTLIEASKDLGAGRWATFRQVTLPIACPGSSPAASSCSSR